MKRELSALLTFAVLGVVACSSGGPTAEAPAQAPAPAAEAPPPPPAQQEALDPLGTYTFSATYQGMTIPGQVIVRGEPENYTGMIEAEGQPPVEIYSVMVEGQKITVYGDAGGDDLIMTMEFAGGSSFTGTWMLGFDGGEMTGEKIQQ